MKKHLILALPDQVISYPPNGKKVPPEGVHVDMRGAQGSFWRRRLMEGSMVEAPAPLLDTGGAPLFDPDNKDAPPARVISTQSAPRIPAPTIKGERMTVPAVAPPVDAAHAIEANTAADLSSAKE